MITPLLSLVFSYHIFSIHSIVIIDNTIFLLSPRERLLALHKTHTQTEQFSHLSLLSISTRKPQQAFFFSHFLFNVKGPFLFLFLTLLKRVFLAFLVSVFLGCCCCCCCKYCCCCCCLDYLVLVILCCCCC